MLIAENGRALAVSTESIPVKTTRTSSGITLMTLKAKNFVERAEAATEEKFGSYKKFKKSIPSSGSVLEKK